MRKANLNNPFSQLRRINPSICAEQRCAGCCWPCLVLLLLLFLLLLVVALGLELLEDLLECLARVEETDPVALVGERRFEDPPLALFAGVGLVERLLDLVQVVHEKLVELVGEGAGEVECLWRGAAEG